MNETARPSFDLTREPWIPCETLDGQRVELGFEDVLLRAHELAAVHDESPLVTAMIHRLLLAILHRIADGPQSLNDWKELWSQARFDEHRVRVYLGKWRHRFDLFHLERPFMQAAGLRETLFHELGENEPEAIPAGRLALERSAYSGGTNLLEHGGDDRALVPAEAARGMLAFLGFGPGGRIFNDSGYPTACPLRVGAIALARGRTLHQTLILNLLVLKNDRPIPAVSDDAPAWEQGGAVTRGTRAVLGWLDALTWQARRVELMPEATVKGPRVKRAFTGVGLSPSNAWTEPMNALVVRDRMRGPEPIRINPERAAWRDSVALFQSVDKDNSYRAPFVSSQMARLIEEGVLQRSQLFEWSVFGLASSQASIYLWRAERMPLPMRLLADAERLSLIAEALGDTESIEEALRGSTWLLARKALSMGDRSPDKKDVQALVNRLDVSRRLWSELGGRFDRFLRDVGQLSDPSDVVDRWVGGAKRWARDLLGNARAEIGDTARALQAGALAENRLTLELGKLRKGVVR